MAYIKHGLLVFLALLLAPPAWAGGDETLLQVDASWNELHLRADVAGLGCLLADDWLLTHSDHHDKSL